jgi:protein involved in polysaccharide export with SLBB domain
MRIASLRLSSVGTRVLAAVLCGLAQVAIARAQVLPAPSAEEIELMRARLERGAVSTVHSSPLDLARERAAIGAAVDSSAVPATPARGTSAGSEKVASESAVERDFSERSGQALRQLGYELFVGASPLQEPFTGAVPDTYVLGIGDELVVTLRGQASRTLTTRVDREGRVLLPDLPPIPAAGRAFGELRADLEARVQASRMGMDVFLSVGALRMIRVVVAGEVERGGVHSLTGLSTTLEALFAAGGIKKTGSLRRIQVRRGGSTLQVDLYDLLLHGNLGNQLTLLDGDMVVVPTLGPTVAVGGDVRRPAIFELAPDAAAPTLADLLEWAGGPLRPSGNRILQVTLDRKGLDQVVERRDPGTVAARDGDILLVQASGTKYGGSVFLAGHVRTPGLRSLASAPTVRRLVPDIGAVREQPYLLFAVLSRLDRQTGARKLVPVDLTRVLAGSGDIHLQADDVLIVPSADDVLYLVSADIQELLAGERAPQSLLQPTKPESAGLIGSLVRQPESVVGEPGSGVALTAPSLVPGAMPEARAVPGSASPLRPGVRAGGRAPVCRGLAELGALLAQERAGRYATSLRGLVEEKSGRGALQMACPEIYDQYPELLRFMLEHAVAAYGELRTPGVYPVLPGTSLAALVSYAGGFTRETDQTNIEITRFQVEGERGTSQVYRERVDLQQAVARNVLLQPGDVVRFNPVFSDRDTGPVSLAGEFIRPGVYNIRRGERLSEIIERAGGLTPQAYPYGAVFTRERVKREEQANFKRYIRELQSSMATATARTRGKVEVSGAVQAVDSLIRTLAQTPPVGRVVVEADPTVLQVRPEEDTILEPGDALHVPKRPNYVSITGEVLNSGAVAFKTGANAADYVRMAGGFTDASDEDRTFVIYPNGSAQPLSVSAWNFTPTLVPPGSTIVVPRDPLPFDWMLLTTDITGILRDLAVAAASLAVIDNN